MIIIAQHIALHFHSMIKSHVIWFSMDILKREIFTARFKIQSIFARNRSFRISSFNTTCIFGSLNFENRKLQRGTFKIDDYSLKLDALAGKCLNFVWLTLNSMII